MSKKADARTRTEDPFITSFEPLSPPVTRSQLKVTPCAGATRQKVTHGDWR